MIELITWILNEARDSDDLGAIIAGTSERLLAAGIPVCRTSLGMPTIDPIAAALNFVWWRGRGLTSSAVAPEDATSVEFKRSPIGHLIDRSITEQRWRIEEPEVVRQFALFGELRAQGVTEYAVRLVPFSQRRTALQGAALSVATDRRGGFNDAELHDIGELLPALSLAAYRIGLLHVATETLGAYLGTQTAARVLQGRIRRGDTEVISAALLLADLRGFTALADGAPAGDVVLWLDQHLACIGDAVSERGGEVLKFLGDGLLAVFGAEGTGAERACGAAMDAALDASLRNAKLNTARAERGEPRLDLSIALHFGDVAYGNVGTARRLDFTVIGPAVNELSRMEALGKALGRELLLSQSIARRCGRPVLSLGPHALRGVAGTREMYIVAT
jgi:adenylate cyclase